MDGEQEPLVALYMPDGSSFFVRSEEIGIPPCEKPDEEQLQKEKWEVTRRVYRYLAEVNKGGLAWGILTGVRPTKLIMQKLEAGESREEILRSFQEDDLVSLEKAQLSYEIACREHELLSRLDCAEGFSLYVGIPFCPSVCSYCSFSSSPIDVWRDRVDGYLDALVKNCARWGRWLRGENRIQCTSAAVRRPALAQAISARFYRRSGHALQLRKTPKSRWNAIRRARIKRCWRPCISTASTGSRLACRRRTTPSLNASAVSTTLRRHRQP